MSITAGVNRRIGTTQRLSAPKGRDRIGKSQSSNSHAPLGLTDLSEGRFPPACAGGYRHCAPLGLKSDGVITYGNDLLSPPAMEPKAPQTP